MRLLLRQTEVIEARMQELHALPVAEGGVGGQQQGDAENTFLKIACQLDTYGVDPHPVKVRFLHYNLFKFIIYVNLQIFTSGSSRESIVFGYKS